MRNKNALFAHVRPFSNPCHQNLLSFEIFNFVSSLLMFFPLKIYSILIC
jgi:hypothetical protein